MSLALRRAPALRRSPDPDLAHLRLGYNQKAAQDTLKVIERTLAGGAIESRIEYR